MGRTSKKIENTTVEEKATTVAQEKQVTQDINASEQMPEISSDNVEDEEEIPPHVVELMRLYSHYKEIWVTSCGFVHPAGVPKYLLKDAVLYKNKFYNK